PLDFEYSVLRNARSLDVYKALGPVEGKAFIIPREEQPFAAELLQEERGDQTSVVIYPTSRLIPDELDKVINALQANRLVSNVYIKPHPNSARPIADQVQTESVIITSEAPKEPHVAIVGNSSVAIEVLHTGIPVYQNFSFDPVVDDY